MEIIGYVLEIAQTLIIIGLVISVDRLNKKLKELKK